MDPNTSCIFFAGGKKFQSDPTNNQSNLLISKNADGSVSIALKFTISKEEAKDTILNYSELPSTTPGTVDIKANTLFVEAYDKNLNPQPMEVASGTIMLGFDKDDFSEIILKGYIVSGKTDHAKTDHLATGG